MASTQADQLEALVLTLWRRRGEAAAVAETTSQLQSMLKDPAALDAVEFYLPQFAHMLIQLGDVIEGSAELEKFVLAVCQMSVHFALQFFWIVYASLQEHCPKKAGSKRGIYARCARMLLRLEQCVAYGVSAGSDALGGEGQQELVAACLAAAAEAMARGTSSSDEAIYAGFLFKKGGGTSTLGRRTWKPRYFEVRQRVLYYYANEAAARQGQARGSIYLSSATLVIGQQDVTKREYKHYFEVHSTCGLRFKLRSQGPEQLKQWVQVLRAVLLLPEPPGMSTAELKALVAKLPQSAEEAAPALVEAYSRKTERKALVHKLAARSPSSPKSPKSPSSSAAGAKAGGSVTQRYRYFSSQRAFVRRLTDLAEELRPLAEAERQPLLQPALSAMPLPPMTFFPLGHSSAKMLQVLRFAPHESVVFHTKARCPLMLFVEVQELPTTVASAMLQGGALATAASGETLQEASKVITEATTPDVTARKREGWEAKVARIGKASELAKGNPGWKLTSMFVKSNDDLRQEVFVMQLISFCQRIFPAEHAWLASYHIQATGPDTGLIETITSAQDLGRLKKSPGYTTLRALFESRHGPPEGAPFKAAQAHFSRSLAAYSVLMWILLLRDRHNENLMLDDDGHYFHVDFGFVLGHSTGKQIGGLVECSPFKMTAEYIDVLDGLGSETYKAFCASCVANLRAARSHGEAICTLVEVVGTNSVFPCFQVVPVAKVAPRLRERLCLDLPDAEFEAEAMRIVNSAANHKGTAYYDKAQNMQRGIAI